MTNAICDINNIAQAKWKYITKYDFELRGREFAKECEEYFERRFKSLFKSVKSLCDMKKRLAQNGQMRLTFGKERDTIMAFMGDSDE